MKSLELHRIAAVATGAVVAASAFAITPVTANTAAPRRVTADVELAACWPDQGSIQCQVDTGGVAYANLLAPFTREAVEWLADPALNGTWTVAPAAPGEKDTYALQQASDGRWLLFAPTAGEEEELVKLVAAAAGPRWTLQNVAYPVGAKPEPLYGSITPCNGTGCGLNGYAAQAGVGALTAAVANPFAIVRQIANNQVFYAGLFAALPPSEAIATIVGTVVKNARAVTGVAAELVPRALEDMLKRVDAVLQAAVAATSNVLGELKGGSVARAFQAFQAGFIHPIGWDGTVASSVPGTTLAATTGPGLISNPADCSDTCYVSSVAVEMQQRKAEMVHALGGSAAGQPEPDCAPQGGACPMVAPAAVKAAATRSAGPAAAAAEAEAEAEVDAAADLADIPTAVEAPATPAVSAATPQREAAAADNAPRGRATHTGARGKRDASS